MTPPRAWALVAVALLVAFAGCNAFVGSADPGITDTVTPVPVPAETATATAVNDTPTGLEPAAFAGVTARGALDAERLLAAHVSYLSERSYTVTWSRRTAGGSGPAAEEFERRVRVADDGTYLRVDEGDVGEGTTITYVGPGGAYRQTGTGANATGGPVVVRAEGSARERFARTIAFKIEEFFGNGYSDLSVVERDGRRYVRAFTTRPPPSLGGIYDAYTLRNFTATVWIAPEGYVQALHYEFDLVSADESLAVEWRYAYTRVGETTVERPDWVPVDATASPTAGTVTPDPSRVPPPTVANATAPDATATSGD